MIKNTKSDRENQLRNQQLSLASKKIREAIKPVLKKLNQVAKKLVQTIKKSQKTHPNEWIYLGMLLDNGNPEKRYPKELYSVFRKHIVKVSQKKGFEKGDIYIVNERLYSKRSGDPDPEDIMTDKFETEWKGFDLSDMGKFALRVCDRLNYEKKKKEEKEKQKGSKVKFNEKEHSWSCICPRCMELLWSKDYNVEPSEALIQKSIDKKDELIENIIVKDVLEKAKGILNSKEYEYFSLWVDYFSFVEIGEMMGINEKTVRKYCDTAVKKLIKHFLNNPP